MKRLLIATGLLFIAQAPLAAADSLPPARTSSVAEMLQLKQEHQLREQLVREGRWEEVRKLDEAQQRRQKMHTKQTLTKMNAEIARESTSDAPLSGDGDASFCAPGRTVTKLDAMKTKQDSASTGNDSSNVR